ncbi:GTP-binding protein SAR2 isoform X2 [Quercus suber]|uniref:GTP-binding protein SAR2 isoform X2 n=1 Tax=Quercus suber TaxID=58331 RepID=UPI0032DF93B5
MILINWVQVLPYVILFLLNKWFFHFFNIERQSISRNEMSSNTTPASYLTSWVSCIGKIKFKFYDLGSHWIARRVWRDYSAKMDAVVYIVNANTKTREQFSGPREELSALLSDEAFANVPFLIFCITTAEPSSCPEEELCSLLDLTNITTGKGRVDLAVTNARPLKFLWLNHATKAVSGWFQVAF